jgi:hypothetical protein
MKIDEYKQLEKKINGYNFNESYKNINLIMTVLSYLGNIASIFLAYFFMSKIIGGALSDNPVAVAISSIVILAGIELLKRDIFDKFSILQLKEKKINKIVLPLFIASGLLIFASFYSSLNGAKEFSSKSTQLEQAKEDELGKFSDSLNNIYSVKIQSIETEATGVKQALAAKDQEQTDLAALVTLNRTQRQRVVDLKEEKKTLRSDLTKLETDITNLKTERDTEIEKKKNELESKTDDKKEDNSKNSFIFVILSTIIELVILAGVYFNEYYKFRSYREYREKIEKDPNYQKWLLYDQMLDIIYTEDTKMNQKLPSNKAIIEMCKVHDIIVLPKDVTDFLKVLSNLGIIKVSGSAKYINKQKDLAITSLKKQYGVE